MHRSNSDRILWKSHQDLELCYVPFGTPRPSPHLEGRKSALDLVLHLYNAEGKGFILLLFFKLCYEIFDFLI